MLSPLSSLIACRSVHHSLAPLLVVSPLSLPQSFLTELISPHTCREAHIGGPFSPLPSSVAVCRVPICLDHGGFFR